MGVSLSIKDVPEALAERLRERARRNHRSLQRELMALVEAATSPQTDPVGVGVCVGVGERGVPLRFTEPPASYASPAAAPTHERGADPAPSASPPPDDLLAELDRIVEGSRWGEAPLLTRDQLHDRALARELDFDCREAELGAARARTARGG